MGFKMNHSKCNGAYDLSGIRWLCTKCGGKKRPASSYAMSGRIKYCYCDKNYKKK